MSHEPSNNTPALHLANQMRKIEELSGSPVFVQEVVGYIDSICETSAQVLAGIPKLVNSLHQADIRLSGINNLLSIRQLREAVEGFISYFQQAETQLQTRVGAHDAVLSNCSDKQALVSSIGILRKKLRELQIDYEKIGMQIRKDYQV